MAVRRPRGWLGPAVLAFIVLFIVSMRQRLLDASRGTAGGPAAPPFAPPRTHWSSADLGVFPHHVPGEVSSRDAQASRIEHRGLAEGASVLTVSAVSSAAPLLLMQHTPARLICRSSAASIHVRAFMSIMAACPLSPV